MRVMPFEDITRSYCLVQPFSTGIPRDPRVLRKVATGSVRDRGNEIYIDVYKHRVFIFTLACVYVNNDH
jgi:hypothetical protein